MNTVAESIRGRAVRAMPGGITRTTVHVRPHPPYAAKGVGARIVDVNGHEVIDANNNYTSLVHGHAHPDIVRTATEAVHNGSAFGLPTASEVELAETLSERTGMAHWRFCNSGTEAVMMALRCARAVTGRSLVVRFSGSYHGTYDGVVDGALPGLARDLAHSTLVLARGDMGAFAGAMKQHGAEIAAVLIDLMPNRAGLVPADPAFVEAVSRQARAHGALLVVDEVITFRLAYGGMSSLYGLRPDIMVTGKVIGGGFPAGAIGGSTEILRPFDPNGVSVIGWGGTFSANPVTMKAGRTALDMFDHAAIERLNAAGEIVRSELGKAGIATTGRGSLIRLTFGISADWWKLYDAGLLACTNGLLSLSTAMSTADVEHIIRIIVGAIGRD